MRHLDEMDPSPAGPPSGAVAALLRRRVGGRRELVPDLQLVPVDIPAEEIGIARYEITPGEDLPARRLHGASRLLDVHGPHETEAEVPDAARASAGFRRLFEDEHVPRARGLRLNESAL